MAWKIYDSNGILKTTVPNIPASAITGDVPSTQVALDRLGSSSYYTLQDMQKIVHSAGWTSGGVVTDNGDGTIAVSAGTGLIRATDSDTANIVFANWSASTSVALTNNSANYIYIKYNGGSPTIEVLTTKSTDYNTKILLAQIYRNGTHLHINSTVKTVVANHAALMMRNMNDTMPFANAMGGNVAEVGTRQFNISAGDWWNGLVPFSTPAFDGTTQTFGYYYRNGSGGWTEIASSTAINNTQYDNGTGTLATLSNNKYGVHWVFIGIDGDVNVLFGQGDYTLTQAQSAEMPTPPAEVSTDSHVVAKIIIKKSDSTFTSLESLASMGGGAGGSGLTVHDHSSTAEGGTAIDLTSGTLELPSTASALATNEGAFKWDSTAKGLKLYDGSRERGVSPVGFCLRAYPIDFSLHAYGTGSSGALAANGGTLILPIYVPSSMLLDNVTLYNSDATLARAWGWDLYCDLNNGSNALTRIASSNGNETFTAAAASQRRLAATSAPVVLAPGVYILAIQNRHASNSFTIGALTPLLFASSNARAKVKTTANPNGATLDIVAATWTKSYAQFYIWLEGRTAGETSYSWT